MSYKIVSLDSKNEWNKALSGIRHSFCHTWEYCYAMHLTTGFQTYLFCFEKDGVRIVSSLTEKKFEEYQDLSKPFGFNGFAGNGYHPGFLSEWNRFISEKNYVSGYLGLHPVFGVNGLFDSSEIYHYNNVYVLDLKPNHEEILNNMSNGRKNQLLKFDEISPKLSEDRIAIKNFFLDHYNDFLKRRKAKSFYYLSAESISYLFSIKNILVIGAFEMGKCVAASLFGYTKQIGVGLYHVSLPGAEHYSAHLVWYAAKKLKSIGIPKLNLGGGTGGIAKFKKRFGTDVYPLKCVKQVYRKDIYDSLCQEINADPNDFDGFFPSYRKK